jgi:hypothetical protein
MVGGGPTFTYADKSQTTSFTGPEITLSLTPDGTMVSVLIHHSIDTGLVTFSILIPRVQLGSTGESAIETPGITTIHMVPDRIALGQLDQYAVTPMQGTAHVIVPPREVPGPRMPGARFYY